MQFAHYLQMYVYAHQISFYLFLFPKKPSARNALFSPNDNVKQYLRQSNMAKNYSIFKCFCS